MSSSICIYSNFPALSFILFFTGENLLRRKTRNDPCECCNETWAVGKHTAKIIGVTN